MGFAARVMEYRTSTWKKIGVFTVFLVSASHVAAQKSEPAPEYLIGAGSYDITGPAADVNMMGYANPTQNAAGIHLRLRSRAFIIGEPIKANGEPGQRLVFVSVDACMGAQGVTLAVLKRLKDRYGGIYDEKNVVISGIHTHSGPGGYLQYVLYIITSLGFVRQSFDVMVDGIEKSIIMAHESLQPGNILVNDGELLNASISRSPSAYLNNPPEERARYKYDTDKEMTLLRFTAAASSAAAAPGDISTADLGALSWFPVHCVSMSRTNTLVSGDNKGAASRFMEDWFASECKAANSSIQGAQVAEPALSLEAAVAGAAKASGGHRHMASSHRKYRVRSQARNAGGAPFVAAFAQSNEGDVTPNIQGAFCSDTGLPCDFNHSTCNGRTELCNGRGPSYPWGDEFDNTRIIGERQFQKAKDLFLSASEAISGPVDSRMAYHNMANLTVNLPPQTPGGPALTVQTCPAAAGFSFAGGTTDGPGAFDFKQGDNKGNLFWRIVGGFIKRPSRSQVACQHPKPVLLDTGEIFTPYAWAPSILPISIHRVGQLIILAVPAEFSTMSGRRLREAVLTALTEENSDEFGNGTRIVIAGLANAYSQYVTTFEEYQAQRYEGASTLYGPHTLSGYIQEFQKLARALARGEPVPASTPPEYLIDRQLSLLPPVVADTTPVGVSFGDVKGADISPNSSYTAGDVVEVSFYTGCPRNDLHTEGTFAAVERLDPSSDSWVAAYDDDDWSLRFKWARPFSLSTESVALIRWEVPIDAPLGQYRIRHNGASKHFLGPISHFTGTSNSFTVT